MCLLFLVLEFLGEAISLTLEALSLRLVDDVVSESAAGRVAVSGVHLCLTNLI